MGSLNSVFDIFSAIEGTQSALLIMASLVGITIAVLMSNREGWLRMLTLGLLGIGAFAAAYKAEYIFIGLDLELYETFNLNLCAEFVGGLVALILFDYWDDIEDTITTYVLMITLLVFGLVLVQYDGGMFGFAPQERAFMDVFSTNLGVEVICAVILFMFFFKAKWLVYLLEYRNTGRMRETFISLCGLFAIGVLLLITLLPDSPLQIALERDDLSFGLSGAVMTSLILSGWVTSEEMFFPPIMALTMIAISWMLLNYGDIGMDISVGFSAELLGALIATVLTEQRWLWKNREVRKISLVG